MPTSRLQNQVKQHLFNYFYYCTIYENYRPVWLKSPDGERLELDFYIKNLKTGIKIQGEQHFVYVPFFHKNQDEFLKQKKRDGYKKSICQSKGITLIEISSSLDIDRCLEKLLAIEKNPKETRKALYDKKLNRMIDSLAPKNQALFFFDRICKLHGEFLILRKEYMAMKGESPERLLIKRNIEDKLYRIKEKISNLKKLKSNKEISPFIIELWNELDKKGIFFIARATQRFHPKRKKYTNF